MSRTSHPEVTYGATRSMERLVDAVEAVKSVILREVVDQSARTRAIALVGQALGVAVEGVSTR